MTHHQTGFTVRWALFSLGRIARQSFWLGALLVLATQGLILARLFNTNEAGELSLFWILILILSWPISMWVGLALKIKRLHDINISAFFALLVFIPFLSTVLILALALCPHIMKIMSMAHRPSTKSLKDVFVPPSDPLANLQALLKCPSVTPEEGVL